MRTLKYIVISVAIIVFDLAVYIMLGLMLMTYDDFYDASKGEYWSLESMTPAQQATYIGLHVWHGVNALGALYLIYSLAQWYRRERA